MKSDDRREDQVRAAPPRPMNPAQADEQAREQAMEARREQNQEQRAQAADEQKEEVAKTLPLTLEQQQAQAAASLMPEARRAALRDDRVDAEEQRKLSEKLQREVDEPNPDGMKLWLLTATDAQAAPFHHSNVRSQVFAIAESPEMARRLAVGDTDLDAWEDPSQTKCVEFKPEGPMIIPIGNG